MRKASDLIREYEEKVLPSLIREMLFLKSEKAFCGPVLTKDEIHGRALDTVGGERYCLLKAEARRLSSLLELRESIFTYNEKRMRSAQRLSNKEVLDVARNTTLYCLKRYEKTKADHERVSEKLKVCQKALNNPYKQKEVQSLKEKMWNEQEERNNKKELLLKKLDLVETAAFALETSAKYLKSLGDKAIETIPALCAGIRFELPQSIKLLVKEKMEAKEKLSLQIPVTTFKEKRHGIYSPAF